MKGTSRRLRTVLAPLMALLALVAIPACAASMPAVTMKVVDESSGMPVAGVVALIWGTAHEGTITGHGGKGAILFTAEAVSDRSGELHFPNQEFNAEPFFLNTNYENPQMILLKPGYAPLSLHNEQHIIPTLAEASVWERDGQTVTMKKATDAEILGQAYWMTQSTNMVAGPGCAWKRSPQIVVTADRMFGNSGSMTTLGFLFMNDALFVKEGCGSPKAFFASYLRP